MPIWHGETRGTWPGVGGIWGEEMASFLQPKAYSQSALGTIVGWSPFSVGTGRSTNTIIF